jgi:dolichol-phosphate hexosyltransferase
MPADQAMENVLPLQTPVSRDPANVAAPRQPFARVPVKISILMCPHNEEQTVMRAVGDVLTTKYPCEIELIIVDDCSTDATPTLLALIDDRRVTVHRHRGNRGKGAAMLAALALATGTHIVPFDADLEYSAEDIARMVTPVINGRCDVVYGTRLFGCNTVYQTYRYTIGNRLLTGTTNILFNCCLSDLHTCLKLIPLNMVRGLRLREPGFGLDIELTAMLLRMDVRPFEVPISYYSQSHGQGKEIKWRDVIRCLTILSRVRLLRVSRLMAAGARPEVFNVPPEVAEAFPDAPGHAGAVATGSSQNWEKVGALDVHDEDHGNAAATP